MRNTDIDVPSTMNSEEEESTLSRLTQLMRVGVPYDQLERELKMKGCAQADITRILDQVKARLRGSPVKRDMGYGDTSTEDSSSYFALPGLSFDLNDDVKTKLGPSGENEVAVGEGFLRKIGVSREQAKSWMYSTDPLENDSRFKHFVKLTGVGVPKETIAAKMSREGVDANMITKFSQLADFRKRVKVRDPPTSAPNSRYSSHSKHGTPGLNTSTTNSKSNPPQSAQVIQQGHISPIESRRGRSSYQPSQPAPSSGTSNTSHRMRSYSANTGNERHNKHTTPSSGGGHQHQEKSFDAPPSSSYANQPPSSNSYSNHHRDNKTTPKYETSNNRNQHRSMSASSRQRQQHQVSSSVPPLSTSAHYGSKSVKTTYDHFEYSNAVKRSGENIENNHLPSGYNSSYIYPSKDDLLEVDSFDYGQSGFGGSYNAGPTAGSFTYHAMKTPEKKKKEKPWQRPTPYSPTSDMYRLSPGSKHNNKPKVNFGDRKDSHHGSLSSSSSSSHVEVNKVEKDERDYRKSSNDTRAMLQATGLSKEVVDTLAGALGGGGDQEYTIPTEGYIAHRGRMASNDSVTNGNRVKSVDDLARGESDRHRALLEQEANRLDQLWHEFSHRRHNSLGRRSNEDVRYDQLPSESAPPTQVDSSRQEYKNDVHNDMDPSRSNNENNKQAANMKTSNADYNSNIKFSPSKTNHKAYYDMPPPQPRVHDDEDKNSQSVPQQQQQPSQTYPDDKQGSSPPRRQPASSSTVIGPDDLLMMEELAKSMSILAQTNIALSSHNNLQDNDAKKRQATGLKEVLVEAHINVKKLVGAKQAVENDLRELQESVTRSSSLLIDRAAQQQVEFEGKEERIRALELRLKEAGQMLEEAREHATRAASSVAAGEQQLLEEAEKMVERQQAYIGELEDQIQKLNEARHSEKQADMMAREEELEVKSQELNHNYSQEVNELRNALEAAGRNMTSLQQDFESERMELNQLIALKNNEVNEMRSEIIQLKESNDKLRRQVTTLLETNIPAEDLAVHSKTSSQDDDTSNQNNKTMRSNNNNNEDNEELKEINENLSYSLQKCEEELTKSTSHCKKLEHTNRELRKELEELREETTQQLEEEMNAKEEIRKQWAESAQRAEKGLASLRAEHERFLSVQSSGLNAAEDAERKLREENDTLSEELSLAQRQYAAAVSAKQAAESRCAMLTKKIEQSNSHRDSSDENLEALKADWESERTSLKENIANLKHKLDRATTLAATEREACFEARKAAAAADNARLTLEDEHLSARVTIKQLQVSAAQQDRIIRDLERKVSSSSSSSSSSSTARDSVRESVRESALQREVNALKEELELARSEHERDNKRMRDLEQDILSLSNRKGTTLPPRTSSDDDIQKHKDRLLEAQQTDEEKESLLTQVAELESLLDSRTRELRLAQSTIASRNAVNKGGNNDGEVASLRRQLTQSTSTVNRLESEVDQLRARLLTKEEEMDGSPLEDISLPSLSQSHRKAIIGSDETPLLEFVLSTNEKVRELKQQTERLTSSRPQQEEADEENNNNGAGSGGLNSDLDQLTQQIEELQLKSTRCMMSFLKSCVVSLTKKELGSIGRVVERAYDSRSCANMIKEGYQGVKKVLFKSQRARAAGRNEEWHITPENLASAALHREMLPSLSLMVVGFDNLAPPYHSKIAKSQELNLNMHWIVRIGDVVAKAKLSRVSHSSQRKQSPDPSSGGGGGAGSNSTQDRGRARSRSGQQSQGGSTTTGGVRRSASAGSARNRSVSVSTRFSVGSNDDYDDNT